MGTGINLSEGDISKIIERLAEGLTLKKSCEISKVNYPNVVKRIHESEVLTKLYARAKDEFAHYCVQEMFEIVDSEPDVQKARLKCDNVKWYAARVLPKQYGDKVSMEHSSDPDKPLFIVERPVAGHTP
jgi:hypothetical protein